jgi:hypothetical protein
MNTTVKSLVDRLFVKILQRNVANDDIDRVEALLYLNEATRELYRWCSLYIPWVTQKVYSYKVGIRGESVFTLPYPFTSIRRVTINGKDLRRVLEMEPSGRPGWDIVGFDKVQTVGRINEIGDNLAVIYLSAEVDELLYEIADTGQLLPPGITQYSIFPQMFDDILILGAMMSYEIARGMNAQTEDSIRSKWLSQVTTAFSDSIPTDAVGEYYQSYQPRGYVS